MATEKACACKGTHKHEGKHTHGECCAHEHKGEQTHGECCAHEHEGEHAHGECCAHSHESEDCDDDGCGCGHNHGEKIEKDELVRKVVCLAASILLVLAAEFIPIPIYGARLVLCIIAYLLVGGEVLWHAVKNIARGKIFDENFLMAVATVGAFAIGDYAEGVAVMIFYQIGETLQDMAVAKSRKNIAGLMDIRPDFATVLHGSEETRVQPEAVNIGDVIIIKPGERVPLDCTVLTGSSAVDASALTGESVPVEASEGTALASGSVNMNGVLTATVTSSYANSTVQKILALVSEAGDKKAPTEKFITRFAKVYTPIVMGLALLIAVVPPLFTGWNTFDVWFYRGLIFLVVSCPCALVLSIPVSYLGGIGGAAKNGILVKGGEVLDTLCHPANVVFDKTGTLTQGKFTVRGVRTMNGATEEELLAAAALCERSSNHPIAVSVRAFCGNKDSGATFTSYEEKAGRGIVATVNGTVYAAGNERLMAEIMGSAGAVGIIGNGTLDGTVLFVAKDKKPLGLLLIGDEIKDDTKSGIAALRSLGVQHCMMLTGDNEKTAAAIAEKAGLDSFKAGLLPQDKVAAFEALCTANPGVSLYAGDGINDAPLLARADVGIAMGGVGSDAAIEAADVVLMTDQVSKIGSAIKIARDTRRIVQQNIAFALGVKVIVMILAVLGYTPMWLAIFADVGVALIAVLNATRAIRLHG